MSSLAMIVTVVRINFTCLERVLTLQPSDDDSKIVGWPKTGAVTFDNLQPEVRNTLFRFG
jgi:hypothetical protein